MNIINNNEFEKLHKARIQENTLAIHKVKLDMIKVVEASLSTIKIVNGILNSLIILCTVLSIVYIMFIFKL